MRTVRSALLAIALCAATPQGLAAPSDDFTSAMRRGDLTAAREAVVHGAPVNQRLDGGTTALAMAAASANVDLARFLVEHGADVNAKTAPDMGGLPPTHIAASVGSVEIVSLLLDHGASAASLDDNRDTPLHLAALFGRTKVVALLVARGADVNALAAGDRTPLHLAASRGSKDTVALLIALGADRRLKDSEGRTPYDVANSSNLSAPAKAEVLPLLAVAETRTAPPVAAIQDRCDPRPIAQAIKRANLGISDGDLYRAVTLAQEQLGCRAPPQTTQCQWEFNVWTCKTR